MRNVETPPVPDLSPVITAGQVTRTLYEHRDALGLSKYRLAQLMGVDKSWVTRAESGERPMELRNRKHLELLLPVLYAKATAAGANVTETAGEPKAA